jgi:hypothetical protein
VCGTGTGHYPSDSFFTRLVGIPPRGRELAYFLRYPQADKMGPCGDETMKHVTLILAALLLGLLACKTHGDDPKIAALMERKLAASQKVLAGIAQGDFDKIAKNAQELSDISRDAQWRVLKTPLYAMYSTEFQRIAETLAKNARDKNLDGASLSYVELTLTCVKCHKHVREVRMARLDLP